MRKKHLIMLALLLSGVAIAGYATRAGAQGAAKAPPKINFADFGKPGQSVRKLDNSYLQWPVAAQDKKYEAIDGHHLHKYVEEATAIGRHYRDAGHPQYWGRIMGTSADVESADWFAAKLKAAGLQVRRQPIDLPPQWMPGKWNVSLNGTTLESANPGLSGNGTGGKTLDVEVVYAGFGNEADFIGRDVKGKAVLIYAIPEPGVWGNSGNANEGAARAFAKGAAAVLDVIALPGNVRTAWFVGGINMAQKPAGPLVGAPGFTMGLKDGDAVRKAIEASPGKPPHLKISLESNVVAGQKTEEVYGTLPGTTDEEILFIAHRDGYWNAAGDNASGMAAALGLAEYFAKIPQAQRKRTIVIMGSSGHHGSQVGVQWLADHKDEELAKVALAVNLEHVALTQRYQFAGYERAANTTNATHFQFHGSQKLIDTGLDAFNSFGVATYDAQDGVAMAETGPIANLVTSMGVINVDTYYHTDAETDAEVPWTGLQNITRAFAKVVDGVNRYSMADLKAAK